MYATHYDKLQTYHVENMLQLQYLNVDSFVLSMKSNDIVNALDTLQETQKMCDFSNSDKNQKLFSKELKKVTGLLKIETPKNIWLGDFVRLRSKLYACKTGNDYQKKLKGIQKSYSKNIEFDNILSVFNQIYEKECTQHLILSIIHDMFVQKVTKKSLSPFDDKREFINNIESIPFSNNVYAGSE